MRRETRELARNLRRQGKTVGEIAKAVGASKGSVSVWVRDIALTEEQKEAINHRRRHWAAQNNGAQTNRNKHLEKRRAYQDIGRDEAKKGRPLHLIGCMLYWAEGTKHRNRIGFVNSDPHMLLLFKRFLREELHVQNSEMVLYIHCHSKDPVEIRRIEQYWLHLLELPQARLRKTYIKKGSDTRRNILQNGVCTICVYRTDLAMHIYGGIQEYVGFENPDWLF